jgi:thioredoxin reductase
MLDVLIVGAGPSGLAASLAAKEQSLRFATIEQEGSLGGTVYHYPRNKIAMTSPMRLPLVGRIKLGEVRKEALLAFWTDVVNKAGLQIAFGSRMLSIEQFSGGFRIATQTGPFAARHVLLAIGRRGTPRRLEVPGEELPKVVYRLIDAEQYLGQQVLVVGGGDSAVEAALAVSQGGAASVSLSYRGSAFNRIKPANRERLERAAEDNRVRVLLESEVSQIARDSVALSHQGRPFRLANDAVIVCAGGVLPTEFLRSLGVQISTHHGKAETKATTVV